MVKINCERVIWTLSIWYIQINKQHIIQDKVKFKKYKNKNKFKHKHKTY